MPNTDPLGPKPDMVTGYENAGQSLDAALRDAERRLLLAGERKWGNLTVPARLGDVSVHTQYRSTYADPHEKRRIVRACQQVLNKTLFVEEEEAQVRFHEALAAMTQEDERIFVVVLTGNVWDFVYWNWRHGYTLDAWEKSAGWKRFRNDAKRRKVAAPSLAEATYGNAVVRVTPDD